MTRTYFYVNQQVKIGRRMASRGEVLEVDGEISEDRLTVMIRNGLITDGPWSIYSAEILQYLFHGLIERMPINVASMPAYADTREGLLQWWRGLPSIDDVEDSRAWSAVYAAVWEKVSEMCATSGPDDQTPLRWKAAVIGDLNALRRAARTLSIDIDRRTIDARD